MVMPSERSEMDLYEMSMLMLLFFNVMLYMLVRYASPRDTMCTRCSIYHYLEFFVICCITSCTCECNLMGL